jgi:hypothetical protein
LEATDEVGRLTFGVNTRRAQDTKLRITIMRSKVIIDTDSGPEGG